MASPFSITNLLQIGFWPCSTFGYALEDKLLDDYTIGEEYVEDAPFVGRMHNC
jgi:hypothetical protein